MNVNDISLDKIPEVNLPDTPDRIDLIFRRQSEIMKKYFDIECKSGLRHYKHLDCNNINDKFAQAQCKEMAWRVTEELGEASLAMKEHPDDLTHCYEELSDVLHFLVELLIFCKVTPLEIMDTMRISRSLHNDKTCKLEMMFNRKRIISTGTHAARVWFYYPIESLTGAMNCLKQKPWKQTHILTDIPKLESWLHTSFINLIELFISLELSADDVFRMYFKKSEVNKFRIRSRY